MLIELTKDIKKGLISMKIKGKNKQDFELSIWTFGIDIEELR